MSPLNCQLCQIHSVHTGLYRLWLQRVDHLCWFKEWAAVIGHHNVWVHRARLHWILDQVWRHKTCFQQWIRLQGSNSAQWSWTTGTRRKTHFWAERNRFGEPAPGSWYCEGRLTGLDLPGHSWKWATAFPRYDEPRWQPWGRFCYFLD